LNKRERWLEKIVPADLDNYLATFQKHCENLSPYNLIYRIKNANGEQRYVKESGFFLSDEGRIISIVGIISDITNQKDLEQKVSDYNTFLHVLLDTIPMPIFYENIEGNLLDAINTSKNKYYK
jgi:two-component system sensor histidine kinase/response regulator